MRLRPEAPEFLLAVALGAGATVIIASLTGFPISTTHALTGALVGSELVAVGSRINFSVLGGAFVLPLLVSPLFAATLSAAGNFGVDRMRGVFGDGLLAGRYEALSGRKDVAPVPARVQTEPTALLGRRAEVLREWRTNVRGQRDYGHLVSAGIVSFARGLNDTPKIVALLMVVEAIQLRHGVVIVAVTMAVGGLLHARRIAEVMSKDITPISPSRGFAANIATGLLVIAASRMGLPVSTTHVSVGAIFGLGAVSGDVDRRAIGEIVPSWVLMLPIAAILSGVTYAALSRIL